ncbi:hypothetical protein EJ02DRAFT_371636 [Clathrospora elynae]|uniref:Uncharacterized protein n=1 Tax=Clathrospora elynae TaxID=706981 RepID=A0A6A5SWS0_9PLEO|nr:hypothetical protein EJ02DRAFT_371636 [Clathrospora elynae]
MTESSQNSSIDFDVMIGDDFTALSEPDREDRVEKITADSEVTSVHFPGADAEASNTDETPNNDGDEASTERQEALTLPGTDDPVSKIAHNQDVLHHAKGTDDCNRDHVTTKSSSLPSAKQHRIISLPPGIDLDNVIDAGSLSSVVKKESKKPRFEMTPPTSSASTSSYSLRNRNQSKLAYDFKYHPMDDRTRPTQAAKRRSAHGEKPVFLDSDNSSEAPTIIDTDADESSDDEVATRKKPKQAARKKRSRSSSRTKSLEVTRRSSRKTSDPKLSYNMDIHPQDHALVVSSDSDSDDDEEMQASANKRRKLTRTAGANFSKTKDRKQARGMDLTGSDSVESRGGDDDVNASVETAMDRESGAIVRTSSPLTSVATTPPYGIRREEGIEIWHMPPGGRYFRHDRDAWPMSPGQPFEIFEERLEDQLAREAMASSPLKYEHDDKENDVNNADLEPIPDTLEGISVMPASQYRRPSVDSQLSRQRALVSHVLYDDEPLQSYGLDGSGSVYEERTGLFPDCMDILASGERLPRGQTQEEHHFNIHDSVLGGSSPSHTLEYDSEFGPSSSIV